MKIILGTLVLAFSISAHASVTLHEGTAEIAHVDQEAGKKDPTLYAKATDDAVLQAYLKIATICAGQLIDVVRNGMTNPAATSGSNAIVLQAICRDAN
jgi:hypothetical protein